MTSVAFIGLGRMGAAMAANIAAAGFPLTVYNRTREKADLLAASSRVMVAETPGECAADADIVILMLADEAALRSSIIGPQGVLSGLRRGSIVIDMGTSGPDAVKALAAPIAEAGAELVDAPVSGSVAAAASAGLTLMVGGTDAAVSRARPVLEAMSSRIFHLGPVGSGNAMKLAVNLVIFGLTQAVAEGLVLAESAGIEPEDAYEVFENSAVAAPMVKYRRDAFLRPDQTPPAFALTLAAKDLHLILDLAYECNSPAPQTSLNAEVTRQAIESGLGEEDIAALATYLRQLRV